MSRKPTIVYDGAIYHIIQRGNNRAHIYNDQLDKAKFCDLLKETMEMEDYGFSLLYYVLMDNHYHLIIETPEASIDRIMHRVNMMYTKYFNKKYGRKGVLYEGRYTGLLILENSYLQSVIRYIAYNPVRAGLVKTPAEYRWCAHLDIVATKHGLVDVAGLLSKFDQDPAKAKALYAHLISGDMPVQKNQRQVQDKKLQKRMTNLEAMLFSEIKGQQLMTEVTSL